ncbi:hypothetical protein BaRGS_00013843 [Batillaria attramentaria]|uniref:Uncharacterized protein n=1 Tax=Batillaria attramentaria TaxID=370345 RepID=A0ABD0L7D5_9CAEN
MHRSRRGTQHVEWKRQKTVAREKRRQEGVGPVFTPLGAASVGVGGLLIPGLSPCFVRIVPRGAFCSACNTLRRPTSPSISALPASGERDTEGHDSTWFTPICGRYEAL